jgi:hypothetical protein
MRTLHSFILSIAWITSTGLLFGCAPSGAAFKTQELTAFDIEAAVKNARTKTDHESIAAYYEREAKSYQAKAKRHERMSETYAHIGFVKGESPIHTSRHCDRLARTYREAAEKSRSLARQHRQLAETAN